MQLSLIICEKGHTDLIEETTASKSCRASTFIISAALIAIGGLTLGHLQIFSPIGTIGGITFITSGSVLLITSVCVKSVRMMPNTPEETENSESSTLTLQDLNKENFDFTSLQDEQLRTLLGAGHEAKATIPKLSIKALNALLPRLATAYLQQISETQWANPALDLSQLSDTQIANLFHYDGAFLPRVFDHMHITNLNKVIGRLPPLSFYLIPIKHFYDKKMDLSSFTEERVNELTECLTDVDAGLKLSKCDEYVLGYQVNKEGFFNTFLSLPLAFFNKIGHLLAKEGGSFSLSLLKSKDLNLTHFSREGLQMLLAGNTTGTTKQKLQAMKLHVLNSILDRLPGEYLKDLSDEQLMHKDLCLEKVSEAELAIMLNEEERKKEIINLLHDRVYANIENRLPSYLKSLRDSEEEEDEF